MTILNRVFDYALRIKSLLDNYKKYRYYAIAIIGVLIVGIGFFVYLTGGIKYVFSHSMYLPIIISALLFGARGGIIAGLVGGFILGPFMPISVASGEMQMTVNWVYRTIFFVLIGAIVGQVLKMLLVRSEQLQKNEKEFRSIFELGSVGINQIDLQTWQLIRCNDKFTEITGYSEDELKNMNLSELTHAADRSQDWELFNNALSGETTIYSNEKRYIRKDGNIIWVRANASFMRDKTGKPLRTVGVFEDITDRKLAEEKIIFQKDALTSLFTLITSMRTTPSIDDLFNVILNESCKLLNADAGVVMMLSHDRENYTIVKTKGLWLDQVGSSLPVSRGLCSEVWITGKPYITDNYETEENALHFPNQSQLIGPMLLVPLQTESEIIGVLEVSRYLTQTSEPFSPEEVNMLNTIGGIAGNALHRQILFESAQGRLKQLQGLRNIDLAITGSLDLNFTFGVILNEFIDLLNLDAVAILRLEKNTVKLHYDAARGFYEDKVPSLILRPGEGYAGQVVRERKALHIDNLSKVDADPAQGPLLSSERFATYYAVPLITKGRILGVLEGYHREAQKPNEEWRDLLKTLANQVAIAIDNAEMFQNMEDANLDLLQAYDATIEGWAYALDLRDGATEDHTQRVTRLTLQIARKMNIREQELVHLRRGALLHDIGKMGIPDAIFLKPGKLDNHEWEIMRKHPVYAYEMLSKIEYLRPAIDIPYCHHEKWNGTGYPRGLKGDEIPLSARIFAVADVYDALTSDRPYRKAWSKEEAIDYIKAEKGKHFDPEVVELFLQEVE